MANVKTGPRFHFICNGHKLDIWIRDDGGYINDDNQAVSDIDDSSSLKEGGFRVVEDGEECTYEWTIKSQFFSRRHTPAQFGETDRWFLKLKHLKPVLQPFIG